MSLEFNRRSFLKYTAAATVAVAGSSLLAGCGSDEYQKSGTLGSTLKLMGEYSLDTAKLVAVGTATNPTPTAATAPSSTDTTYDLFCKMSLECTSKFGLNILPSNFQVEVIRGSSTIKKYHYNNTNHPLQISNADNYLEKDDSMTTNLTVTGITVRDGDTIKVKFWPRPQASEGSQAYTRAFCSWTLKVDSTKTPGYIK